LNVNIEQLCILIGAAINRISNRFNIIEAITIITAAALTNTILQCIQIQPHRLLIQQ